VNPNISDAQQFPSLSDKVEPATVQKAVQEVSCRKQSEIILTKQDKKASVQHKKI